MSRYTKKRKSNGVTQVYDSSFGTWILLSALSTSDAHSCESLSFDSDSSLNYDSGVSSSTYDSDSSYSSSSCDSGGSFGGCD